MKGGPGGADEEILEKLVALNHERAEEEKRGLIRWLRPEFQNPSGQATVQPKLAVTDDDEEAEQPQKKPAKAKKEPWPAALPERMRLVHQALASAGNPLAAKELASRFKGAKADTMDELLATLAAVGQARRLDDGRYAA